MQIALCDDQAEDLKQLTYLIGTQHFTTAFSSGEALLVSMEEFHERYDLYLLDIFMEGISGLELARQIRRLDPDALLCFVSTSDDFYREAYNLYIFQYLVKPISQTQIHDLLQRAQMQIQLQRQQQIVLETRGKSVVVPYHKLIFVTSRGHTLLFQCQNKVMYSIREKLSVFGDDYDTPDGSCIRDYIYVVDLAKAHVIAMDRILNNKQKEKVEVFNIGTGKGVSVLELINTFEKATGVKLNYQIVGRRAGDIEKVWANPDFANKELGWKAEANLEDTLRSAWNWQLKLRERGIQ